MTTDLYKAREVARTLLANIRDVVGEDEELIADTVEGETPLFDAMRDAVARLQELEAFEAALKAMIADLAARKSRFETQGERIRTSLALAIEDIGLKSVELPNATLSFKKVPPKVVISEEADIPPQFMIAQDPVIDRKAILAALKAGETVPGAGLSNGSATLAVKYR